MARKIGEREGKAALSAWVSAVSALMATRESGVGDADKIRDLLGQKPGLDADVPRKIVATAVRYALQVLETQAPGHAVEVRVPPFGAVQVLEGTTHRRGTPPAVVEMAPEVWLGLACGIFDWDTAVSGGFVSASGNRSDLGPWLPLQF